MQGNDDPLTWLMEGDVSVYQGEPESKEAQGGEGRCPSSHWLCCWTSPEAWFASAACTLDLYAVLRLPKPPATQRDPAEREVGGESRRE